MCVLCAGAHAQGQSPGVKTAALSGRRFLFQSYAPPGGPLGCMRLSRSCQYRGGARRRNYRTVLSRMSESCRCTLTDHPNRQLANSPALSPARRPTGCGKLPKASRHKAGGRRWKLRTVVFRTPERGARTPTDASVPLFGFLKGKILRTQSVRPDFHPLRVSLPTFCTSRK